MPTGRGCIQSNSGALAFVNKNGNTGISSQGQTASEASKQAYTQCI